MVVAKNGCSWKWLQLKMVPAENGCSWKWLQLKMTPAENSSSRKWFQLIMVPAEKWLQLIIVASGLPCSCWASEVLLQVTTSSLPSLPCLLPLPPPASLPLHLSHQAPASLACLSLYQAPASATGFRGLQPSVAAAPRRHFASVAAQWQDNFHPIWHWLRDKVGCSLLHLLTSSCSCWWSRWGEGNIKPTSLLQLPLCSFILLSPHLSSTYFHTSILTPLSFSGKTKFSVDIISTNQEIIF